MRKKSKLYYGYFGNNGQYKYYCPFCDDEIWWSTSWNIKYPACEHFVGNPPYGDHFEKKYSWKWKEVSEIELTDED